MGAASGLSQRSPSGHWFEKGFSAVLFCVELLFRRPQLGVSGARR